MHVLVTGASGFIGEALTRLLVARGHRVTALGRRGSVHPASANRLEHALGSGVPIVLPKDVEAIAHLAQSRAYRAFPGDAAEMFSVNVAGAQEMLSAAAATGVTRFCMVSTGSVYEPFSGSLYEAAPLAPLSYLGATKLAAEAIAQPFSALFPLSVLRLFGPYGPAQTGRLVPDLISNVRKGLPVTLPEEGGGMRFSPTYVDDICDLMGEVLEQAWSGTFNVAAQEDLTIEAAASIIGTAVGRQPVFQRKTLRAPCIVPELSRLAARYDMARFRSFADGIAATLASEQ